MPRTISLLDQATIPQPCPLARTTHVRFCTQCGKHVHNLSAMPRAEGEQLLEAHAASCDELCVQMKRRRDGRVLTRDGLRVHRWWRTAAAVVAAAFSLLGYGCGLGGKVTGGDVALQPYPPPPSQSDQASPATAQR